MSFKFCPRTEPLPVKSREVFKLLTTRVTLTTSDWAVLTLTVTPKINTSLREMHQ